MLVYQIVKAIVLPPGCILALAAAGLLVRRSRPRLGTTALIAAWALLALLSLPACSGFLVSTLEHASPIDPGGPTPEADAIVVLSADIRPEAAEYGGDTIGLATLMRLRYGAWLHRKTGLPVLVTGGRLKPGYRPLGDLMAETLEQEFGIEARWIERESRNTAENAREGAKLLRDAGVRRILLVTSATHVPRARAAFEAQGFEVVPAPTGSSRSRGFTPGQLVPSSSALLESTFAIHEWLGRAWYRVIR
jgi:uncharacterized SAM-binding protein YcdF (DUF218 family)